MVDDMTSKESFLQVVKQTIFQGLKSTELILLQGTHPTEG